MPLRIPSHWAVMFNIFVEFPADDPPTPAEVDAYLSDDILSVEQVGPTGRIEYDDPTRWVIDLGWYPRETPKAPTGCVSYGTAGTMCRCGSSTVTATSYGKPSTPSRACWPRGSVRT